MLSGAKHLWISSTASPDNQRFFASLRMTAALEDFDPSNLLRLIV
jgi:hypothetical protein